MSSEYETRKIRCINDGLLLRMIMSFGTDIVLTINGEEVLSELNSTDESVSLDWQEREEFFTFLVENWKDEIKKALEAKS